MKKAIFLDRDGTINVEVNYLHKVEDFEFVAGTIDALITLKRLGYLLIVITNQAGIAKGYYSLKDVEKLHWHINNLCSSSGCSIDAFYVCPHHPDVNGWCQCRKPRSGMLDQAILDFDIDPHVSYMVGDKVIDIAAGESVRCKCVYVRSGHSEEHLLGASLDTFKFDRLIDFANYLECEIEKRD